MVDPRPSEPKSYIQNVNVSSSNVVNKNQPKGNHTLLKQFEAGQTGAYPQATEEIDSTESVPQSLVSTPVVNVYFYIAD